jgi:hypothetical protein
VYIPYLTKYPLNGILTDKSINDLPNALAKRECFRHPHKRRISAERSRHKILNSQKKTPLMDSSARRLPVVPGRPLFRASDWQSARERAVSGDDFSRTPSYASHQASSVDSYSQGGDQLREGRLLRQYLASFSQEEENSGEARLLRQLPAVEGSSTSDSTDTSFDSVPMLDELVHYVFSFHQPILSSDRSSANCSASSSLSSKIKSAIPATKASAPGTRTPDVSSKPSEASLALKLTANSSMGSRVGRCHDDEYDASIVGQEVECTIIGLVDSNNEQDHDNYGHAIHSMVSDAGGQEVEYSKDRESSHLLSPDNAKDPNLRDDKHHRAMKAPAPPASLALKLTANSSMDSHDGRRHDVENSDGGGQEVEYSKDRESSHLLSPDNAKDPNLPDDKHHGAMKDAATPASLALKLTANTSRDSQVGRRRDEENDSNSGQGLQTILKVPSDKYIDAIGLRDSIVVAEPSALPITPTNSISLLKMRDFSRPSVEKSSATPPVIKASKLASKGAQKANETGKEVNTATPHKMRLLSLQSSKPRENTSMPRKEVSKKEKSPPSGKKSLQRLQKLSPEVKSVKPKSSQAVFSSHSATTSVAGAPDSPSKVITGPAVTETKSSAVHTLSKKSHSLESKHGTRESSVLKTFLSAVVGEWLCRLCRCGGVPEWKNETEESGPNDADQIDCNLHSDKPSDPMNAQIEIETAPAIMPVTALSQGKQRSALKSLRKRLPLLSPESRSLHSRRKSNQISEQKEGRNDTETHKVGRSGSKRFVEMNGMDYVSAVINNKKRGQSQIASKILRPHPESRFLRGRRKRNQMPEQNQIPEKKEARNETEEPRELMLVKSDDFWD